jgi:nitrogen fixation protein NifU and related proteins
VTLRVTLKDVAGQQTVEDVSYDPLGCSISQASASVMSDLVIGKPVEEAMRIGDAFLELMKSKGQSEPDEDVLEDAVAFAGVSKYPSRIKCALLGWMAWKDATARALGDAAADATSVPATPAAADATSATPAAAGPATTTPRTDHSTPAPTEGSTHD